jgi:hypothetical protein
MILIHTRSDITYVAWRGGIRTHFCLGLRISSRHWFWSNTCINNIILT